ncbi:16293_t:CDS:2 [Dentiscutata heterogama]|uniref:16293_t:CDS:1 n=1 Tax=Dentiscutata heterogama TaxID=1316150 RepID=A0ACA9M4X2_9GLOM|nr:16293_t:CDS:2 [Dentiscutata heterogama]
MDSFIIVQQYADGGNLRNYFETKMKQENGLHEILWTELIKMAKDISNGLKYLHDQNIVHQDLWRINLIIKDWSSHFVSPHYCCIVVILAATRVVKRLKWRVETINKSEEIELYDYNDFENIAEDNYNWKSCKKKVTLNYINIDPRITKEGSGIYK